MEAPDRPSVRSYGRTRSRTLKPHGARRIAELLPRIALPGEGDLEAVTARWPAAVLEIGFGAGEHLAAQAAARPEVLFIGAEPFQNGVAALLGRIEAEALDNIRIHMGDVREVLGRLPDAAMSQIFILFPDPWPKLRHHKRRLLTPALLAELCRCLAPSGRLRFATDWADYAESALMLLLSERRLEWAARRADDWRRAPDDHAPTRYEVKGLGDVKPLYFDFRRREAEQTSAIPPCP